MQRVPTAREQPASGQAPAQLPPASGQSNQGSGADGAAQEPQQVSAPGRAETGGPSQALAESQQSGGLASGAPQSSSGALKYMVMAGTGEKMLGKSRGRHEIICKSNQATLEI